MNDLTIVIVPGLRGHVEEHWQTILAGRFADTRTVPVSSDSYPRLEERVAALDRTLATVPGRAVLVAHSAGVVITAHWAQRHPDTDRVAGALLAAPPDLETPLPAGNLSPRLSRNWAGPRYPADHFGSRASSPPARTIRWPVTRPWPNWPIPGAADW
ncbi:alpha/beta fold hydrolase [Prescottella defluvii]|nr:alpha/beta fold hydrolase [Prescottella defluvii]